LFIKILLADDSLTAQNMAKSILTDAGYDVLALSSAAEVIRELPDYDPTLLILDIFMQGTPAGLELCRKLRAEAATASATVLLAVGKMEPQEADDIARVRPDGVIEKPFESTELLAQVKQAERLAAQRPRPEYSVLRTAQSDVPHLWPASAVARIVGTTPRPSAAPPAQAARIALAEQVTPAHVVAVVMRVLTRRVPQIVAEILEELGSERARTASS
jgi:DNA-binding response OmpR family regulator